MSRKKNHSRHFDKPSHKASGGSGAVERGDRYWLYGRHAVLSAIQGGRKIHRLWITQAAMAQDKAAFTGLTFEMKSPEEITSTLPHDAVHQGLAIEVGKLEEKALEDIDFSGISLVAVLDQVTDPHNAGAILRSAAAFDVGAVIVPKHGSASETATMAKAASGALDMIPLVTVNNLARSLEELKEMGFWIIGLDGEATTDIQNMPAYEKIVLVLGSEGKGLRRLTAELCDLLVKIPIHGRMESLNVSNAAAVAFYALAHRTASGK